MRRLPGATATCLVFALLATQARPVRSDEPAPPAWASEGGLTQALDAAVAAVEEVCGARFTARPTVKRSTPDEVRELLRDELSAALAAQGGPALEQALAGLAQGMFAKYAPEGHVVHVMPDNAERIARLLSDPTLRGEAVLRVVMAHEVAHALDFQRFPGLDERRRQLADRPEAARAVGAVIEGHAQWAAARVARRWGLEAAFETFTRSITAVPEGLDPVASLLAKSQAAEFAFAYVRGQAFCEAVERAQGVAGLERALAEPPTTPEEIEVPERWLDPSRAPAGPDVTALLALLGGLARGEGWQKAEQGLLRAALQVQIDLLPPERRADALEGYEGGRVLVAQREDPQGYVAAAAMQFDEPARAARWIELSRAVSEAKDAQMATGAVRVLSSAYADLPGLEATAGFRATKRVALPGLGEKEYVTLVLVAGRRVVEVTVFDPDEAQREALAGLPAALAEAEAAPPR